MFQLQSESLRILSRCDAMNSSEKIMTNSNLLKPHQKELRACLCVCVWKRAANNKKPHDTADVHCTETAKCTQCIHQLLSNKAVKQTIVDSFVPNIEFVVFCSVYCFNFFLSLFCGVFCLCHHILCLV